MSHVSGRPCPTKDGLVCFTPAHPASDWLARAYSRLVVLIGAAAFMLIWISYLRRQPEQLLGSNDL